MGGIPNSECERPAWVCFDADGDACVDLWDFSGFQECLGSAGVLCLFLFDDDDDSQVDLDDFAAFQAALGGPGAPRPFADTASRFGNPYMFTAQRFEPTTGLYHFYGRTYSPLMGHFLERDMQGLLALIDAFLPGHGEAPFIAPPTTGAGDEYLSVLSLYLYVGSNPVNGIDPFGLFDYFDEADDIIAGIYAERAGAAHHAFQQIGRMAQATAQAALFAAIAAMCPPAGLAMSAWGLAESLEDMYYSGLTWENTAGATLSAAGVGAFAGPSRAFLGKLRGGLSRTRRAYGAMRGRSALASLDDEFLRFRGRWHRGTFGSSEKSFRHHWDRHGRAFGASPGEYTDDAISFWRANRHRARKVDIGYARRTGYKIDGAPGGTNQ